MSICCIRTSEVTFCGGRRGNRGFFFVELGQMSTSLYGFMGEELNWSFQDKRTYMNVYPPEAWCHVCVRAWSNQVFVVQLLCIFRCHAMSLKPPFFHIGFTHQPFKLSHFFILAFCFLNLGNGIFLASLKTCQKDCLIIAFAHLLDWL